MKPGYMSTEFWLTCGGAITAFYAALQSDDMMAKVTTGVGALAAIAFYTYTRHAQKMKEKQ